MPLSLATPYTIAYETISRVTNVFVSLKTDIGLVGLGCAAPDKEIMGDTPESVLKSLQWCQEQLIGKSASPNLLKQLAPTVSSSALAAVDMALWDLKAKEENLPLCQLWSCDRDSIETSITIGILPLEETIVAAQKAVKEGFQLLKLKGGLNVKKDMERVFRVREAVGSKIKLLFDGNQGYDEESALRFSKETEEARVEFIEQPTDKSDIRLLGRVSRKSSLPIMADESLLTVEDAILLANEKLSLFNIKLQKVGGLTRAEEICDIAKASNIQCMVGCMDESALSISAALHFALANKNVTYADLDGHLDLVTDPASKAVILKNGRLYPSPSPGLGMSSLDII